MNTLLYWFGRALVAFIQALPLKLVARLGRTTGALAFWLDARHRRVALQNLEMCFGREKSPGEIRAIAMENFRRIGENYVCAIKTAAMSSDELWPYVEFCGSVSLPQKSGDEPKPGIILAMGHLGNFELFVRYQSVCPGHQLATTYRALKHPVFNRLMQDIRQRSGCLFFERRTGGRQLRAAMNRGGIVLGLLADQNSSGLRAPFLDHDCNTGLAPAVFALRYRCQLYPAICHRVALAKWRLELGEKIATHENGRSRPSEDIMRDVNRALETAVRRDPANWFWVHRRWKI